MIDHRDFIPDEDLTLPHATIAALVLGAGVTVILAAIGAVTVWGWL